MPKEIGLVLFAALGLLTFATLAQTDAGRLPDSNEGTSTDLLSMGCWPRCLRMAARLLDQDHLCQELDRTFLNKQGPTTIAELQQAATSVGLCAVSVVLPKRLPDRIPIPIILHLSPSGLKSPSIGHFVLVVDDVNGKTAVLDPPFMKRGLDATRLRERWVGTSLIVGRNAHEIEQLLTSFQNEVPTLRFTKLVMSMTVGGLLGWGAYFIANLVLSILKNLKIAHRRNSEGARNDDQL